MKRLHYFLSILAVILLACIYKCDVKAYVYAESPVIEQPGDEAAIRFIKESDSDYYELYTSKDKVNWSHASYDHDDEDPTIMQVSMQAGTTLYAKVRGVRNVCDENDTSEYSGWSNILELVKAPDVESVKGNCTKITVNSCTLSLDSVAGANI